MCNMGLPKINLAITLGHWWSLTISYRPIPQWARCDCISITAVLTTCQS